MPERVEDLSRLAERLKEVRETNVAHHLGLIAAAAGLKARIVCLQELFTAPYFPASEDALWFDLTESAQSGPTIRELCKAAERHEIMIVAPIYESDPATGGRYDTAVVIDAEGLVVGKHRRTYGHEPFYYSTSGADYEPLVFETALGRIGINIGEDRRVEGSIAWLKRAGAQFVFCPAAASGPEARALWRMELKVDAARHKLFIGGANRLGAERPWNRFYFGESYFAGPDGAQLENLSKHPNIVVSDLELP